VLNCVEERSSCHGDEDSQSVANMTVIYDNITSLVKNGGCFIQCGNSSTKSSPVDCKEHCFVFNYFTNMFITSPNKRGQKIV